MILTRVGLYLLQQILFKSEMAILYFLQKQVGNGYFIFFTKVSIGIVQFQPFAFTAAIEFLGCEIYTQHRIRIFHSCGKSHFATLIIFSNIFAITTTCSFHFTYASSSFNTSFNLDVRLDLRYFSVVDTDLWPRKSLTSIKSCVFSNNWCAAV